MSPLWTPESSIGFRSCKAGAGVVLAKLPGRYNLKALKRIAPLSTLLGAGLLWFGCAAPALAQSPSAGFGGPSVLGRGGPQARRIPARDVRLRTFASLSGVYDTGLTAVQFTNTGQIPAVGAAGIEVAWGAYASKLFREGQIAFGYKGDYRQYNIRTNFNGSNHYLDLTGFRQLTSRIAVNGDLLAGTTNLAAGGPFGFIGTGAGTTTDSVIGIPSNDFFDTRTYFVSAQTAVVIQKSARLSFSLGGGGFTVRRSSSALISMDAAQARADVAYRVTRNMTIGADFNYYQFVFRNAFGVSNIFEGTMTFSRQFGRAWTLRARAGAFRSETEGTVRVTLDPVVAAIIGQSSGFEAFHRVNILPAVNVSVARQFRQSSFSATFFKAANPGNGLQMTSKITNYSTTFSYTGIRKWSMYGSVGYVDLESIGRFITRTENYVASAGATYKINRIVNLSLTMLGRRFEVASGPVRRRDSVRFAAGLVFSPGDLPLAIW